MHLVNLLNTWLIILMNVNFVKYVAMHLVNLLNTWLIILMNVNFVKYVAIAVKPIDISFS